MKRTVVAALITIVIVFVTVAVLDEALRGAYVARFYLKYGGPLQPGMIDHPFLTVAMRPHYAIRGYHLNSRGLRTPEFSDDKRAGTYRIVVLGGSAATAGTDNADTFESLLEKRLNQPAGGGVRYEVINAGTAYYTSTQEMFMTATQVVYWHPDLVIVYDGFNDAVNFQFSSYRPNWNYRNTEEMRALDDQEHPLRSEFFIVHLIYDRVHPQPQKRFEYHPEGVRVYGENLRMIAAILNDRGIKSVFVLQPTLVQKSGPTPAEQRMLSVPGAERLYGVNFRMLAMLMPLERDAMAAAAAQEHAVYADFTHVLDNVGDSTFYDVVHQTDFGNTILADRLAALIKPLLPAGPAAGTSTMTPSAHR